METEGRPGSDIVQLLLGSSDDEDFLPAPMRPALAPAPASAKPERSGSRQSSRLTRPSPARSGRDNAQSRAISRPPSVEPSSRLVDAKAASVLRGYVVPVARPPSAGERKKVAVPAKRKAAAPPMRQTFLMFEKRPKPSENAAPL